MYRYIRTAFVSILLSFLLIACAAPQPVIQTGPDAEVIDGFLHRVENSSVSKAYVDPAFDIDNYEKILIEPLDVSSIAMLNPDLSRSDVPWQLNDEDRTFLAERYRISMIKNFFALGGYKAANKPGEGVLRIRVAISLVGPATAQMPGSNSITLRHRTDKSAGGGEVRIRGIVDDSVTGRPVAHFVDIRPSPKNWALSRSLSNHDNASFLLESWARMFVYRLQESRKRKHDSGKSW